MKATFTNASMDSQTVALTQGVKAQNKGVAFAFDEEVTVGSDGTIALKNANPDYDTLIVADDEGNVIPTDAEGKTDKANAGKTFKATYAYTKDGVIGVNVKTVSVPGYVKIFFRSKPVKQKDDRIVRINLLIYKARSDGSLKLDLKQKNAFAPELTFNIVDPERDDNAFWAYSLEDVTESEKDNPNVTTPTNTEANEG